MDRLIPSFASFMAILVATAVFGCSNSKSANSSGALIDAPPLAEVRPVVDDYHGTQITDRYRYLENLADPQVKAWMRAQADHAKKVLTAIPGRDAILERIAELDGGQPFHLFVTRRWPNGDLHYHKRLASENLFKLYFRDAKTGQEKLLIDPEKFARSKEEHYSLQFTRPSPDGRYIAYGIAASGSEETVMRILDVAAGEDLADVIDRIESDYVPPFWLPDGSGLVYSRRRLLPSDAPATEGYKQTRAYLHRLGAKADQDALVFAMNTSPAAPMLETDFPAIIIVPGSGHAIGQIKHGDAPEITLYTAPIASLNGPAIPWKKICDASNLVTDFAVHGDEVYLITASGAPRYKVVRTSLNTPDFANAEVVLPQSQAVIESVAAARDALYVGVLEAGLRRIARIGYEPSARAKLIELPQGTPSCFLVEANPDCEGILLATSAWTRRGRTYTYDPRTDSLTDMKLIPRGKFDDPQGLTSTEVLVPSHDGVKVPLSIIHRADLKLDGSNPALIGGYGAYGAVSGVRFNPISLAWLQRGGVLAIAHVRGGGEFGREWHLAGQKATKPNTWKDFIACAQYLVDRKYTSPARLAGEGGSAGGILIGRAITERPDLFAAAIINVGCADSIRFETTTNGVPNIAEFGSTATPEGFAALLAMSPYHNVKDGVKYPAVLLTHGINDPRVEPWESAKMAARLQAATASGKPVLLRIDYQSGHGIGSTKDQYHQQQADEWAFLLWQFGGKD